MVQAGIAEGAMGVIVDGEEHADCIISGRLPMIRNFFDDLHCWSRVPSPKISSLNSLPLSGTEWL